jgi:voltage-gated potassium channel
VATDRARNAKARRSLRVTAATVVAGLLVYSLAPMTGRSAWFGLLLGVATVSVVIPLTVRRARSINSSDRPILDALETLVLLFTLLLFGFASMFVIIAAQPGQMADVNTKIDALYFTATTLSTVGYGDAHAVGQAARVVVTLQIIFDLAFIAVALRLLSGVASRRATQKRETN